MASGPARGFGCCHGFVDRRDLPDTGITVWHATDDRADPLHQSVEVNGGTGCVPARCGCGRQTGATGEGTSASADARCARGSAAAQANPATSMEASVVSAV